MRVVELFCGAGGMSIGFKQAGFEIVHALDAWPEAVEVYRRNVGRHAWVADLKNIAEVAPILFGLRPDVIAGGPPCQDYSSAGGRQEGDRAGLTAAYAMLIAIVRPEWIVMENVPGALKSKAWQQAEAILRNAGYGFTIQLLDAAFYGVGQTRERLIVVGRLGEEDGFLTDALVAAASRRPTTARDVLGDAIGDRFYVHPRYMHKKRIWSADEPAPTVRSTYARRVPPDYVPISTDAQGDGAPSELTRDLVAALQGFPADFDWSSCGLEDRDRMGGNAVPVPLARAIATVILQRHRGETQPALERDFSSWLRDRGHAPSTVEDVRAKANRARRLLGGRIMSEIAAEVAKLEGAAAFQELPAKTQSALRVALRLHAEFRQERRQAPLKKAVKARKTSAKKAA
ncbi:DNA cytosine methyltransferase [Rhizobium rhizosphaerae]|uniref:DNA cytosine methyltransferase n=1 Tax=Xaviernesmea rhizosphaerae TaxID=1672749 RepID=UPI00095015BE|nr:DNA (cytosine-5-)-methyltransferase [Xaviernesmea rhizosphaerae]